jgi:hypothetical protein
MLLIFPPGSLCSCHCNSIEFSCEGGMIHLASPFESAPRHLLRIQNNFSCIWSSVLAVLKVEWCTTYFLNWNVGIWIYISGLLSLKILSYSPKTTSFVKYSEQIQILLYLFDFAGFRFNTMLVSDDSELQSFKSYILEHLVTIWVLCMCVCVCVWVWHQAMLYVCGCSNRY